MEYTSRKYVKNLLKKRPRDAHKGNFGRVLIIGGSQGMTGALVLSAKAALRAGSGLVRVSVDKELFPIVQIGVPEATCVPRVLGKSNLEEYDSIVIGPGLGTDAEGAFAVAKIMQNYKGKVVMDADALNVVSENQVDLAVRDGETIITPHLGEASRLMDTPTELIKKAREKSALHLANITKSITVLKGHNTIIAQPNNENFYINTTGNPGMATGGSGDVLSGVIGSFLGQGMSLVDSAVAGVYVHGLAGDLAKEKYGEYGLIAGDIAEFVAYAIKDIQEK